MRLGDMMVGDVLVNVIPQEYENVFLIVHIAPGTVTDDGLETTRYQWINLCTSVLQDVIEEESYHPILECWTVMRAGEVIKLGNLNGEEARL